MVFYHFLCNMYRIGGSSKMTLVEPSIKTVETFFEYFQDYWHHDWIIRHPTLYWKEKRTKNNANAFWCRNLCQICCPIAEICWWILLSICCWPMRLCSKRNSKIIKGSVCAMDITSLQVHNSHHNINVSIGLHWCEPHSNHAAYPLLAYNDEQHTCDKDNTIYSIGTNW